MGAEILYYDQAMDQVREDVKKKQYDGYIQGWGGGGVAPANFFCFIKKSYQKK